ncbi:MAG: hypothetical protein V3W32_10035, partial [Gemmatimonadota bacterium]
LMAGVAYLFALLPMINLEVFLRWDLTFGSGMQTLGALVAAVTLGWSLRRSAALRELAQGCESRLVGLLYVWIRYVIPTVILALFVGWVLTQAL